MSHIHTGMLEEPRKPLAMDPKKFALWLFIVSITMLFAALTSAYIVRKADGGNWLIFELPSVFWLNTAVIVLSSLTMQWAYFAAKRDKLGSVKALLIITTVLGFYFIGGQYIAWERLYESGVYFITNNLPGSPEVLSPKPPSPSSSFLFVLTGLHALHLISGVIFILIVLNSAFKYKVHSKSMRLMQMGTTYWHFLTILWVYLFVFLWVNHQ